MMTAAPSLGTIGSLDEATPGLRYSEVWGEDFYSTLYPSSTEETSHIPAMALLSGQTMRALRDFRLVTSIFATANTIFLPEAELLGESVTFGDKQIYRAFYFPLAANTPTGMMWPITTTASDIAESLFALKSGYRLFQPPAIDAIEPQLNSWLDVVRTLVETVAIPYVLFSDMTDGFPDLALGGTEPDSIDDPFSFSPILDTCNGLAWRIIVKHQLSDSPDSAKNMANYLRAGRSVVQATSYLGAAIPPDLCPTYPWHVNHHNGWPAIPDIFEDLGKEILTSVRTHSYAQTAVSIHLDQTITPSPMKTKVAKSTKLHRHRIPTSMWTLQFTAPPSQPQQPPLAACNIFRSSGSATHPLDIPGSPPPTHQTLGTPALPPLPRQLDSSFQHSGPHFSHQAPSQFYPSPGLPPLPYAAVSLAPTLPKSGFDVPLGKLRDCSLALPILKRCAHLTSIRYAGTPLV
jgi:hypothetical protein